MFNELPLGQLRKRSPYPSLRLSFMRPKVHASSTQVSSGERKNGDRSALIFGKKKMQLVGHTYTALLKPSELYGNFIDQQLHVQARITGAISDGKERTVTVKLLVASTQISRLLGRAAPS